MSRVGFLADLNVSNNNEIIEKNESIDKLLEIINEKCENSSKEFETISKSDDEKIKNTVINFNECQKDIRDMIKCIDDYCELNGIELKTYISQYHSDSDYLSNIFLEQQNNKQNNISR